MDSVRPDVEKYYRNLGTQVVHDPDQYSTDLKKCLIHISEQEIFQNSSETTMSNSHAYDAVLIGGLEGRADQAFSLLHQLYRSSNNPMLINDLYLITPESILFLLEKGVNTIEVPLGAALFTKYVGIIPIGKPSIITTRGLEWDIKDWHTEFETQVSTSNHVVMDVVEVHTTERVLFTIGTAPK